ncbi:MAG: LamG domain-containing protein [Thermoguttaceae bacterium]
MRCSKWLLFAGIGLSCFSWPAWADEPAKPAAEKQTGPVACWKFDEGTGETAKDSAGKNDGKLVNAKWVDGKVGKAIELSGSNSYAEVPDAPALNLTGAITIEAWVKHKGATFKDWEAILAKGDNTYRMHLSRDKHTFDLGINYGGYDLACEVVPEADKWHFVVATYDGTQASLYVDGKKVASNQDCPNQIDTNDRPLYIGNNSDYPERGFTGVIGEVKIYDRALSADEIAKQYEKTK